MFIYRLYILKNSLLKEYVTDNINTDLSKINPPKPTQLTAVPSNTCVRDRDPVDSCDSHQHSNESSECDDESDRGDPDRGRVNNVNQPHPAFTVNIDKKKRPNRPIYTKKISMDIITREYHNCKYKDSAQRKSISRLLNYIFDQKENNFRFDCFLSSTLYWIISGLIYDVWATQIVWDVVINSFCVWLMFSSSNKYWIISTKYCCCYVCYYHKNNNEQSKKVTTA